MNNADQGSDRYALDRYPHASRYQSYRQRSREIDNVARKVETAIKSVPGTLSAYAERTLGGYYLEIIPDRERLARYGLMIADVQNVVAMALGAEPITITVEGRERYAVSIRYPRDLRSDPHAIAKDMVVSLPGGNGTVSIGKSPI